MAGAPRQVGASWVRRANEIRYRRALQVLQAVGRGFVARLARRRRAEAVVLIQCEARGFLARKEGDRRRVEAQSNVKARLRAAREEKEKRRAEKGRASAAAAAGAAAGAATGAAAGAAAAGDGAVSDGSELADDSDDDEDAKAGASRSGRALLADVNALDVHGARTSKIPIAPDDDSADWPGRSAPVSKKGSWLMRNTGLGSLAGRSALPDRSKLFVSKMSGTGSLIAAAHMKVCGSCVSLPYTSPIHPPDLSWPGP